MSTSTAAFAPARSTAWQRGRDIPSRWRGPTCWGTGFINPAPTAWRGTCKPSPTRWGVMQDADAPETGGLRSGGGPLFPTPWCTPRSASPPTSTPMEAMSPAEVVQSVAEGLSEAADRTGMGWSLILCSLRHTSTSLEDGSPGRPDLTAGSGGLRPGRTRGGVSRRGAPAGYRGGAGRRREGNAPRRRGGGGSQHPGRVVMRRRADRSRGWR